MTRLRLKNFSLALLVAAAVAPALAQKPTIVMLPFPDEGLVSPTRELCGFDILATPQAGRPNTARLILFQNTGIIAGPFMLTLENLDSGKTVDVNVSGPARLTADGRFIGMGPGIVAFPPSPRSVTEAAGLPEVPLTHGRAVFAVDDSGMVTAVQSFVGVAQDVCELLR